jgi:hypothetical protein
MTKAKFFSIIRSDLVSWVIRPVFARLTIIRLEDLNDVAAYSSA